MFTKVNSGSLYTLYGHRNGAWSEILSAQSFGGTSVEVPISSSIQYDGFALRIYGGVANNTPGVVSFQVFS